MALSNSPDVILDRLRFIDEYEKYYKDSVKIDPETHGIVDYDKPYVVMNQDESIYHRCYI